MAGAETQLLKSRLARTEADLRSTQQTLEELQGQHERSGREIHRLEEQFLLELEAIREMMGTGDRDRVYAEAEYLVRTANQLVLMDRDTTTAVQLLQSADEIVQASGGLSAHRLRQMLAQDIAALKAVSRPDTQGIYLELSAQITQVKSLQRPLPEFRVWASDEPEEAGKSGNAITSFFARAGKRLSSLVEFRRVGSEIQPLLPPKEEYYLRQNLVLKLQMAQLALLEGNESVYRSSLQEAMAWVSAAFRVEDSATIAMQEALHRLSEVTVDVRLPDISGSLVEVRALMETSG